MNSILFIHIASRQRRQQWRGHWVGERRWGAYQLIRRQVGQSLVDEGGLLVADHLLAATVADHQLRPHGPLSALLQRHLQAEDGNE